ncbi:MAG: ABC transporter transmembrane domain-containing protein, partial [Candidatus Krumholzibacteria bacterium]|nr:ABC transporter transmembrane domain-containing protein [Candidatus Krumholzibacteria bacterium]
MSDPSVNESKQGKAYDAVLMRRMLRYLRPYRWKVSLAVILLALSSAFGLAGPYLVKVGIDEGILAGNLPVLGFVSILYVLFLLVDYAAAYLQSLTVAVIGQRFMLDIRRDLFRHMSRLSLRFYESNPVGRLVTRV